ncbi:UDP-glucose 4-epimerase GalE [Agaribacterium haliotis]|uniref:UDP-glucose 4-epimerase GalE n=1 Tax=Agaribacterium haliotis TaxID=2013869 RepID=UPI000BB5381D|nr:UDP-glucose 4-epimerase GalE [Agaribacterium haliotis]
MKILVTGGAGYIGSHTCVELLESGYEVVVVDNLCNSKREAISRVEKITGKSCLFYQVDICDRDALSAVFREHKIDAVIHFAGLKAVGESAQIPLEYYQNNVSGSIVLAEVMREFNCWNFVFSSSATVYGPDAPIPYVETLPTGPCNVYGRTKHMVEDIFRDLCNAPESKWNVSLLRYFNPIGAHESGTIGEDPQGIPNNLMPYIAQVAVGKLEYLNIFGDDYDTVDGTGVRDYIHVVDLAKGHVAAVASLVKAEQAKCNVYNLGSGHGYSVLEVVKAFEKASDVEIPYKVAPRRTGDLPEFFADASLALKELGWKTELGIERMAEDTWRWQKNNPRGYPA